jgi:hypothetical protein
MAISISKKHLHAIALGAVDHGLPRALIWFKIRFGAK